MMVLTGSGYWRPGRVGGADVGLGLGRVVAHFLQFAATGLTRRGDVSTEYGVVAVMVFVHDGWGRRKRTEVRIQYGRTETRG
jgi:hypothetical protein